MGITAKELASKLGLSAAAVSMALNNKAGVSEQTREEVIRAAREYGYDFQKIRRAHLSRGKVAYVIFRRHSIIEGDTGFFSQITEGITQVCSAGGYSLDIRYAEGAAQLRPLLDELLFNGADGILLLATEMLPDDFRVIADYPLPLVVIDNYLDQEELDFISINNLQGAYMATKHLIAQKKVAPGYLASSYHLMNFDERREGYYKAIRECGLSTSACIVHHLPPSVDGAFHDMLAILQNNEPLANCYFADNDLIALGAAKAMRSFSLRIPEDIALVGFDNSDLSSLLDPPLTTVDVPKKALGCLAARRLLTRLSHEQKEECSPIRVAVRTSLIQRKSV